MRSLARTSLGMLGLALMAPGVVGAQDAPPSYPSGYQPVAPSASAPPSGYYQPVAPATYQPIAPATPAQAPTPAPAVEPPHQHKGRVLCAKCAAKMQASNPAMAGKIVACEHWNGRDADTICPKCRSKFAATGNNAMIPGKIVGCEHSKNGVCTACRAALNMPGEFVMAGAKPAEAPGRAVASSGTGASTNVARGVSPGYDAGMSEPAPVGVVQANFSQQAGPMGYSSANAAQAPASAPGRAVAESSNVGNDPYQSKSGPFPHPHIIGHLLGWSGLGAEKKEAKARKKAEAHAMISYDESGNASPAPVSELPASTVFGKKQR